MRERTFKILWAITFAVLLLALILKVSSIDMAVLILTIAVVLGLELLNSQVEKTLDILKPEYDERVREIKDIAAAAVLIASIGSAVIGILIFLPYIVVLFY